MVTNEPRAAGYFAETAIGAVVLLAVQFLSLPVLIGGLLLIGLAKLVSRVARSERPLS